MRQASLRHAVQFSCAIWLAVVGAIAQEPAAAASAREERLARLQAAIEQQQRRIAELERQVQDQSSLDVDRARTEALKAQIREVLSEREFRESLMPSVVTAGFQEGSGFYIRSSDDKFRLNLRGFMQFRWTHYETQSRNRYTQPRLERNDRTGFDVQRIRLFASGNAWSPDLTYRIAVRSADASNSYDATIHQAFVNYRFSDVFQVRMGVFQAAGTRAEIDDSDGYQLIDLGLTDAVFSFDQVMGVQFAGRFLERFGYQVQIVNALGGFRDRVITPDPAELDGNPAVLARLAWMALGDDPGVFDYQGDLRKDKTQPALGFELFKYAFNDDRGDRSSLSIPFARPDRGEGGGFGLTTTNGLQYQQFAWASIFKWMGFSAEGEYVLRVVDPRGADTPWTLLSGDDSTTAQHGAYVQCGYFLPIPGWENKFEVAGRVGGISVLSERQEGVWEYAAGINYYPIENNYRVKLQADVQRIYEAPTRSSTASLAEVNDDALAFRVQLQVGF